MLISLCIITLVVQSVFKKHFGTTVKKADFLFSGIVSFFALIFFIGSALVQKEGIKFELEVLPYSVCFAVVYIAATVGEVLSLKWGSLAITSLVMSYSLLIPTVYGLVMGEPVGVLKCIGFTVLIISAFLVRNQRNADDNKKVSFKWLLAVVSAFVCNGFCSVFQTAQERKFEGTFNSSFMIMALMIATVVSFAIGFIIERKSVKAVFTKGIISASLCGICNGATNLLVMVIVGSVAASLFFPVLSAAQLVSLFLLSVLAYKEKFILRQIIGMVLGLMAIVILNI